VTGCFLRDRRCPITGLEITSGLCNCLPIVVVRLKTFVQILMAVLALGISSPQPACAAGTSEAGKTCCCTDVPVCKCHPDKPCEQSCTLAQTHAVDKQIATRTTLASSPCGNALFSIATAEIKYPVFAPAALQRNLNASPPFGGSPPQAMLRLWLI
jgi:hypothetical protein